jgi:hypothetical protein
MTPVEPTSVLSRERVDRGGGLNALTYGLHGLLNALLYTPPYGVLNGLLNGLLNWLLNWLLNGLLVDGAKFPD